MAIKNLALSAVALAIALAAAELALQLWVKPSRLYSSIRSVPAANQWKNEVRFWERHVEREDALIADHDPLLGWDSDPAGDRIRGSEPIQLEPDSMTVVSIGDSFTYGNEVSEAENFSALLDADPDLQVLNMGVPGFGIGQAYLKYRHFGADYAPHVVLFGIYVDDYERASMSFTSAAKPGFATVDDKLVVLGQPVPSPDAQLARISQSLAERVFIVDGIKNLWLKASTGERADAAFFANTDQVVARILHALGDTLGKHQRLLIVHIPRAESFTDEADPFRQAMSEHLIAIYQNLGLAYVDLTPGFLATADAETVFATYYVHHPGGSVGHLSPQGHLRTAELIRGALARDD